VAVVEVDELAAAIVGAAAALETVHRLAGRSGEPFTTTPPVG
jgi:hypothetical protein